MARAFIPHVITNDSALGGNVIEKSLRFNNYSSSADDAQLYRTVSTTSNRRTYTHSFWVKRTKLGYGMIFGQTDGSGSNFCYFVFNSNNKIEFNEYVYNSGGNKFRLITTRVFRDTTAWYHIVTNVDTTQGSAADRVKIYVNGVQETAFDTEIYPDQNYDTFINWTLYAAMRIGLNGWGYGGANCYLSEFNAVDGYAYDPSYFGYTEFQTGIWMPKRYEGTYGTNGYHLKFNDTSNLPLSLGRDASINGNHFQTDNISTSSGTGNDSLEDTPTNNFPTWHPLYTYQQSGGTAAYSDGNLKLNTTANTGGAGTYYPFGFATFGARSGKWYAEFKCDTNHVATGVANTGQLDSDVSSNPYGAYANTSIIYTSRGKVRTNDGNLLSSVPTYASGDIIGVALDLDNNKIYFHKNGSYINSGNPNTASNGITLGSLPSGRTGDFVFSCGSDGVQSIGVYANFGQRAFNYTLPTGYKSMCSKNLPARNVPSIIRPQKHFDTLTYTGDQTDGTRSITGLEFTPDFVWLKCRSSATSHNLYDSVRGFGANKEMCTDKTQAEGGEVGSQYGYVNQNSRGFDLVAGSDSTLGSRVYNININNATYVAWCWKAGGTAVTNTDGTITTQVSVNEEAGFSIATYTGNGATTATIGHGLGKTPAWIIIKNRSSSADWVVMHEGIGSYDGGNYKHQPIKLNSNQGKTSILGLWTTPNSSTQQISDGQTTGGNRPLTNTSGDNYVAYFWAEIPGFSKFGSYTGNGSTDGTYVHLGFRPAWVMIKRISATSSASGWFTYDNKRNTFNQVSNKLCANSSQEENDPSTIGTGGANDIDFLSNGFKTRATNAGTNASGDTYIYMAFAEQPESTAYDTETNAR